MRREKPMVMRVGCHEKRSLPGTAVYTIKAVRPRVTMWNTILPLNTCDGIEGLCQFMFIKSLMQIGNIIDTSSKRSLQKY